MKNTLKMMLSILLVFCMVVQYAPAAVLAAEQELPGNEELFAMYVEQVLYDREWATFGTAARENLNAAEQGIYDALKAEIEKTAANGGSTEFVLADIPGLKMEWTSEELDVESIEDATEAKAQFAAQFSLDRIFTALLSDCPYDLYWYDKTVGGSMRYSMSRSGQNIGGTDYWTKLTFKDLTFTMAVASGYQGGSEYTVTTEVAKVGEARTNAKAIVDASASKTDYEKLVAYKEAICEMVSYNHEAADNSYTGGYGDPWQLIYVFDGDDTTKVVCEGYAKAFQYLCDLGGLECISVSGVMSGGTGAGGHMWNIVTLEGANYLVDVTNCDDGTIGAPDKLFLVGNAGGSVAGGYDFAIGGQTISFDYDSDILDTWTEAELTLAASDYEPAAAPAVVNADTGTGYGTLSEALAAAQEGQTLQLQADCTEGQIMVYPGVTVDLNGFDLAADYLVCFNSAHVIDGVGAGCLIAAQEKVVLDEENDMVPVFAGEGYIFTKAGFAIRQDAAYTGEGVRINVGAYPVRMDAVELLKNGSADNNLEIMILLSWETADGTGSQKFVFTDDVVAQVYASNNGTWSSYGKMFTMTITGIASVENLRADAVIASGTNAAYVSVNGITVK